MPDSWRDWGKVLGIAGTRIPPIEEVFEVPPAMPPAVGPVVDAEGFGDRAVAVPHAVPGIALLQNFYFAMARNNNSLTPPLDHHVQQLLCLVDQPQADQLWVGFHDYDANDRFYYHVRHRSISDPRVSDGAEVDVGVGRLSFPVDRPAGDVVFVIAGFNLWFPGTDHHIDRIGIRETAGTVTVDFNDKNDDDTFWCTLQYVYVPRDLFAQLGTAQATGARGAASAPVPAGRPVVRGFLFDFQPRYTSGSDHHLREIGVWFRDTRVEVYYSDVNGDDGFDWMVRWGLLK